MLFVVAFLSAALGIFMGGEDGISAMSAYRSARDRICVVGGISIGGSGHFHRRSSRFFLGRWYLCR